MVTRHGAGLMFALAVSASANVGAAARYPHIFAPGGVPHLSG